MSDESEVKEIWADTSIGGPDIEKGMSFFGVPLTDFTSPMASGLTPLQEAKKRRAEYYKTRARRRYYGSLYIWR